MNIADKRGGVARASHKDKASGRHVVVRAALHPAHHGTGRGAASLLSAPCREGKATVKRYVDIKPSPPVAPKVTAGTVLLQKLRATGFVGMWKDREDMEDSTAYVQRLREQIQVRADRAAASE